MLISPALRASRGCTYQASAQASLDAPVFCALSAVGGSNRLEEHGRQPSGSGLCVCSMVVMIVALKTRALRPDNGSVERVGSDWSQSDVR